MKRYIRKPIIVEAEQWFPDRPVEGVLYPVPDDDDKDIKFHELHGTNCAAWPTRYGYVIIEAGDYIVTMDGETSPYSKVEFEAVYEPYDKDV